MFTSVLQKFRSGINTVILSGNINDLFVSSDGQLLNTEDALQDFFTQEGLAISQLDLTDTTTSASSSSRNGQAEQQPTESAPVLQTGNILKRLGDAIAANPTQESVLIVTELEQLFVHEPQNGMASWQHLRKLVKLADRNNTFLIIISQQGAPSFIAKLPEVFVIQVPQPSIDDRERYFNSVTYSKPQAPWLARKTEGFTIKKCQSLIFAAKDERDPDYIKLIEAQSTGWGASVSPWDRFGLPELEALNAKLSSNIYGQNAALSFVENEVIAAKVHLNLTERNQPRGVFFFAGATGTGKTEVCRLVAQEVFHGKIKIYDMGEFSESQRVSTLLGSPQGYVGSDEGGDLINWVRDNPYSLILFDEIEKAHPSLLRVFLAMLDRGSVTSASNETVYLNHTIIAFTSNIGSDNNSPSETYAQLVTRINNVAIPQSDLPPELVGRLRPHIHVFDHLRADVVPQVVEKFSQLLINKLAERDCTLTISDRAKQWVEANVDRSFGSRDVPNVFKLIEGQIARAIMFRSEVNNVNFALLVDSPDMSRITVS
jgi:hypothetical protein